MAVKDILLWRNVANVWQRASMWLIDNIQGPNHLYVLQNPWNGSPYYAGAVMSISKHVFDVDKVTHPCNCYLCGNKLALAMSKPVTVASKRIAQHAHQL